MHFYAWAYLVGHLELIFCVFIRLSNFVFHLSLSEFVLEMGRCYIYCVSEYLVLLQIQVNKVMVYYENLSSPS